MDAKFDFSILDKHAYFFEEKKEDIVNFIAHYKGSLSETINNELRTKQFEDLTRSHQLYVLYLDNLIREFPRTKHEIYLYRGLADIPFLSQYFKNSTKNLSTLFKEAIGECIMFKGFLSTTYSPAIACQFANSYEDNIDIVLKIKIPSNFPILAVDAALNVLNVFNREQAIYDEEDEILLPRNLMFRVISVRKEKCLNKDIYLITLDTSCSQIKPTGMPILNNKDKKLLSKWFKL